MKQMSYGTLYMGIIKEAQNKGQFKSDWFLLRHFTESLSWKGPLEITQSILPCSSSSTQNGLPRSMLSQILILSTTSLCSLFQFSVHLSVHLPKPYFLHLSISLLQEITIKSLIEIKENSMRCSPLVHHTNHLIAEGYQVS